MGNTYHAYPAIPVSDPCGYVPEWDPRIRVWQFESMNMLAPFEEQVPVFQGIYHGTEHAAWRYMQRLERRQGIQARYFRVKLGTDASRVKIEYQMAAGAIRKMNARSLEDARRRATQAGGSGR